MEELSNKDRHPFLSAGIVFFTFIYLFFYQLNYPFNPAFFLYIIFGFCLVLLVFIKKIHLNLQIWLLLGCCVTALSGMLYTPEVEAGKRETLILFVVLVFLLANRSSSRLNAKLKKCIFVGSVLVLCGIYLQYFLQATFNAWMRELLRSDCYHQLMWSFRVDNAYAGFSAYTVDAAFFTALLFGIYSLRMFGCLQQNKPKYIHDILFTVLTLFAVFMTSKRGIFVGMFFALLLTLYLMQRISKRTMLKIMVVFLFFCIGIVVFYFTNDIVRNFLNRFLVNDDITTGRVVIYAAALQNLFRGNFMVGFGTGATYGLYSSGMHNIYLQILYDHGFLGLIPYLAFFVYNLKKARESGDIISIYVQLLMLIYGMSGNPLYSNMILMTYLVYTTFHPGKSHSDTYEQENSFPKKVEV